MTMTRLSMSAALLGAALCGCARSTPPARPAVAGSNKNEIVVRRFYDEFINRQRRDVLPSLVAASFVDHTNGARGHAGLEAAAAILHRAFEGLRFQVQDIVAHGDLVAVRWVYTGRNVGPFFGRPPTGQLREQHGINFFRLRDGKIAELWLAVDPRSLRPPPAAPAAQ